MSLPINKETLLYYNSPYKKYRWMGIINVVQIAFAVANVAFMPSNKLIQEHREAMERRVRKVTKPSDQNPSEMVEEFELNPEVEPLSLFQRMLRMDFSELLSPNNIYETAKDRPAFFFPVVGFSIIYTALTFLYTRRMAHKVSLLPTGHVKFSSFSPFAVKPPPTIVVPVRDVSCVTPRQSETNYIVIKIKGYRAGHLIHKTEGHLLEPRLFDEYLGQRRSWFKTVW